MEEIKTEFTEIVDERLQTAIDSIGEALDKKVLEKTRFEDKIKIKEAIKKNILPVWKLVKGLK